MRKLLVLGLVLGLASGAGAALTLVDGPAAPINVGQTATVTVHSDQDGSYSGWLEIVNPAVLEFGSVAFTPAGNPAGNSTATPPAMFDTSMWVQFTVASFNPLQPVNAGNHIVVNLTGASEGTTRLNLYDDEAKTLWDDVDITVIPEPATIILLGLGAVCLRRKQSN